MKTTKYNIRILNNGIMVDLLGCPLLECEKFDDDKNHKYNLVQNLLGRCFWEDILQACNDLMCHDLKVTIAIEENKKDV